MSPVRALVINYAQLGKYVLNYKDINMAEPNKGDLTG